MKKILLSISALLTFSIGYSQVFIYETFDYVAGIIGNEVYDWRIVNASEPAGTGTWTQADMTMGIGAYIGLEPNCYMQVDKFSTSAATDGTISTWILSPELILSDGDSVRFHTVSYDNGNRPDRLEVRVSTLGINSVLPTSAEDVGSFTTLIGVINPTLSATGYPSILNGQGWTDYRFVVSGIDFGNYCRVALRYYVENAGSQGPNGSAIAIDELYITGPEGFVNVEHVGQAASVTVYPNPAEEQLRFRTHGGAAIKELEIVDLNGRVVLSVGNSTLTETVDISRLNTGLYFIHARLNDGKIERMRFVKK